MDYKQLEQEIIKIIKLVEKLPEKYQIECFEVLVEALVKGYSAPTPMPFLTSRVRGKKKKQSKKKKSKKK